MYSNLQIEITNICNNKCIYCPHKKASWSNRDYMTLDNFNYILDKAKTAGIKTIFPLLNGEPTLHPNFLEISQNIKKNNFIYKLITNGTYLNKYIVDELSLILNNTDTITFSLDSTDKNIYKNIRCHEIGNVVDNIKYCCEIIKNISINIQVIKTEYFTYEDYDKTKNSFKQYHNVSVGTGDILNWAGEISSIIVNKNASCQRLKDDICIMLNGDVCLCCVDYKPTHKLGNIFRDSFEFLYDKHFYYYKNFPIGICQWCNGRW